MTWQAWIVSVPLLFFLSLAPGPNNLTAMYNGIQVGPMNAVIAALGRNVAFVILMFISAVGLGAIIVSSAFWFGVVKWLGVVYLLYIGIRTWRNATVPLGENETGKNTTLSHQHYPRMRQEFLIAISNPKAILIFTAIFPQLLDLNRPIVPQFFIIGATTILSEFIATYIYAVSGKQIKRVIKSSLGMLRLNQGIGSLFVLASVLLAVSSRN